MTVLGNGEPRVAIDATAGGTGRRIEEAALTLFFERGYPTTTMREIALACGLTAGALYNHFPSKERLLCSIITKIHTELERMLVEARGAAGGDPRAELAALARTHALFHTRYRTEARVANRELMSMPEADRNEVAEIRRRITRWFEETLERGNAAGALDVTDVRVTAYAILNAGIRIADWFRPGGRLAAEDVAEIHARLALRMAGDRGGA